LKNHDLYSYEKNILFCLELIPSLLSENKKQLFQIITNFCWTDTRWKYFWSF